VKKESFERAKWIPIFIVGVLLIVVYKTMDNLAGIVVAIRRFAWVISPLLFGVLFAYFFYIPQQKIMKLYRRSRIKLISRRANGISVFTILLFLILIVAFVVVVIIPILITSAVDLAGSIPEYVNQVLNFIDNIPDGSIWDSFNITDTLTRASDDIVSRYVNLDGIEQVARGVINVAGGVFNVLLGMVVSLYLLLEREKVLEFFGKLRNMLFKNEKARDRLTKYISQVNKVLYTFIASKGLDSIINLVVVTIIMLIFNVPYAFLFGLIAGLFNFIPYLGSLIAVILISLITVITGGLSKAIQVLIALFIFQQLDANYIEPKIMGTTLKISPVLVIISVVAGGAYFGIIGMFLAVPIVTIVKQILIEYVSNSKEETL